MINKVSRPFTRHAVRCLAVFTCLMATDTKAISDLLCVSFLPPCSLLLLSFSCSLVEVRAQSMSFARSLTRIAVFAEFTITLGQQVLFPPDFLAIPSSLVPSEVSSCHILQFLLLIIGALVWR